MRDSTRGTISTRFLKRTRSTLPEFAGAVSEKEGGWVGEEEVEFW